MIDLQIKPAKKKTRYIIVSKKRLGFLLFEILLLIAVLVNQVSPFIPAQVTEQVRGTFREIADEIREPVKTAQAAGQFSPTNGNLVTGTTQPITSATAANADGVNIGSWKGTLADDAFHWMIGSTSGGYDANLVIGGVQLNGANTLMIQTEIDLDPTAPATLFQICDWSDSTGVDAAADAQCTAGGWRTLNLRKSAFSSGTNTQFHFQIYDGYWSNGSNTPYSTPLTNFVNGSNQIKIRYFSTTNTTSLVAIDFLRIYAVINPVYSPAGFTNLGSGASSGDYTDTVIAVGQTASDDVRNGAAGTAGSVADMYWSFKNVKTYTGMNTILVRSEHSCSGTGPNYRPKIYNFNTAGWEDLTTGNIACSGTDAINIWAKNNITVADYISSGEIRIGFYGLSNNAATIRADYIYVTLGTTNTDAGSCEISFGTNSANDCTSTRDIDTTGTTTAWQINTEDESATFGHDYYPYDYDNDAVLEEAGSSHVKFSVTQPANTQVTGAFFASRHMSGTAGNVFPSLRDYSGFNSAAGGFTDVGATASTSLVYSDNISTSGSAIGSGNIPGVINNPGAYLDTVNNQMWMRLHTTTAGASTNNSVQQWDFAMVSLQWIEDANHPSERYQFTPTSGNLVTGTAQTITSALAAANEGVNTGSWKGTLADDAYHWIIASTAGGYDLNLTLGGVQLNNANSLIIETEVDLDATAPDTLFQICDWTDSTGVDAAADAQCTTGGWRTLNLRKTAINPVNYNLYHFRIFNGYFSDGSNNPVSTPLSNFVNGSNDIKIRYYSTTNTTSQVAIDFLRIYPVISPIYLPAGFTNSGGGADSGSFKDVQIGMSSANGSTAMIGSDDNRNGAAGTAGSAADMYWSFKNVRTYTGMNTVVVRAEVGCVSTGGVNYRPKIYNFTSAAWEDLSTGSLVCVTDTTQMWAKSNISDMADYIDEAANNEMRIGFYSTDNTTNTIRADYIYMVLGSTIDNTANCEISFGSGTATDCSRTRDLDTTGTYNMWNISTENESTDFSHDYYAMDNNADANPESAAAGHIKLPAALPSGASMAGIYFAFGYMSGPGYSAINSGTTIGNIADYSGFTGATGGFTAIGTSSTTSLVYSDNITANSFASGGASGILLNPEDYYDPLNNRLWVRFRKSGSSQPGINLPIFIDFAFVSLQWTE